VVFALLNETQCKNVSIAGLKEGVGALEKWETLIIKSEKIRNNYSQQILLFAISFGTFLLEHATNNAKKWNENETTPLKLYSAGCSFTTTTAEK
jgi:hypothetical protein